MELDDVPVRVTYEEKHRAILKLNRLGDRHAGLGKLLFHRLSVAYFERNMSIARVFRRYVHQDIVRGSIVVSVQDKIDVHAGQMFHDSDRFRADRSDDKLETQYFIECSATLQIPDPKANVIDASDLFQD